MVRVQITTSRNANAKVKDIFVGLRGTVIQTVPDDDPRADWVVEMDNAVDDKVLYSFQTCCLEVIAEPEEEEQPPDEYVQPVQRALPPSISQDQREACAKFAKDRESELRSTLKPGVFVKIERGPFRSIRQFLGWAFYDYDEKTWHEQMHGDYPGYDPWYEDACRRGLNNQVGEVAEYAGGDRVQVKWMNAWDENPGNMYWIPLSCIGITTDSPTDMSRPHWV